MHFVRRKKIIDKKKDSGSEKQNLEIEVESDTEVTEKYPKNIVVNDGVPDVMLLTNEGRYKIL